ncbi:MAG: hypothetical protein LBG47_08135 [Prevotellaceae bacterium]|nr:hypothetical protein [Prevotellaceae bacterium]
MATAAYKKETDRVMDFICETREGKYTAEKPDLTQITYSRMVIQESDASNVFDDCPEEVFLYGISG